MSSRLAEIARQTVAISDAGHYTAPSGATVRVDVTAAVAGTRHHRPDEPLAPTGPTAAPAIEVTHESTLVARAASPRRGHAQLRLGPQPRRRLPPWREGPGGEPGAVVRPLPDPAHRTGLLRPPPRRADLRYSDRVIWSPAVPVFRDDQGHLLDEPYTTSFLTAAAPNRGAIASNQPENLPDVPATLRRRARRVLTVAAAHGHRSLVLGAWAAACSQRPARGRRGLRRRADRCPAFRPHRLRDPRPIKIHSRVRRLRRPLRVIRFEFHLRPLAEVTPWAAAGCTGSPSRRLVLDRPRRRGAPALHRGRPDALRRLLRRPPVGGPERPEPRHPRAGAT